MTWYPTSISSFLNTAEVSVGDNILSHIVYGYLTLC